jgi:hypothetical protein
MSRAENRNARSSSIRRPVSLEPGKVPLVAGLGVACIVGAAALAWFSAPATLRLARAEQGLVTAQLESRLFGLVPKSAERIDGLRSVSLVRSRTGRSQTPDHIVFETVNGPVDLGRDQQLFAVDHADMKSFFEDEASSSLTLSSIARGRELVRFVVAQAIALFLALAGLGLEWMVVRTLMA